LDFAEFYRRSADECLRAVLVSVGDLDRAQDLVAEAFARAWASWRTVSRHPAPAAWVVRTAEVLGIAPGTVTAHLGRAVAAVREELMPERQQESPS
jgi:DNA-directed RNA polymerase specialized sigma24 family protein